MGIKVKKVVSLLKPDPTQSKPNYVKWAESCGQDEKVSDGTRGQIWATLALAEQVALLIKEIRELKKETKEKGSTFTF